MLVFKTFRCKSTKNVSHIVVIIKHIHKTSKTQHLDILNDRDHSTTIEDETWLSLIQSLVLDRVRPHSPFQKAKISRIRITNL